MSITIVEKRSPKLNKWDTPSPAVGRCECGSLVVLQSSTNECDCGRRYNIVGNELRRRPACSCLRCTNGLDGCNFET